MDKLGDKFIKHLHKHAMFNYVIHIMLYILNVNSLPLTSTMSNVVVAKNKVALTT